MIITVIVIILITKHEQSDNVNEIIYITEQ